MMIHPGAVNWMIAGRGVPIPNAPVPRPGRHQSGLFAVQTWIALPDAAETRRRGVRTSRGPKPLPVIEAEGRDRPAESRPRWGSYRGRPVSSPDMIP